MGSDEVKVTERMWSHQSWIWIYEARQQVVKRGADGGPQSIRLISGSCWTVFVQGRQQKESVPPKKPRHSSRDCHQLRGLVVASNS